MLELPEYVVFPTSISFFIVPWFYDHYIRFPTLYRFNHRISVFRMVFSFYVQDTVLDLLRYIDLSDTCTVLVM